MVEDLRNDIFNDEEGNSIFKKEQNMKTTVDESEKRKSTPVASVVITTSGTILFFTVHIDSGWVFFKIKVNVDNFTII